MLRALRIYSRRYARIGWRAFRTALNTAWLALQDRGVGLLPKFIGIGAAFVDILPLEWIPGIHPVAVLLVQIVLIPAMLALAWKLVDETAQKRLLKRATARRTIPWKFLLFVVLAMLAANAVDLLLGYHFGWDSPTDRWIENVTGL